MRYEYLLFNIIVVSIPLLFSLLSILVPLRYRKQRNRILAALLLSCVISAVPFIIWDIAVTDLHWYFNHQYITGLFIWNLPIEEILFFICIPYATGTLWLVLFHPQFLRQGLLQKVVLHKSLRYAYLLIYICISIGIASLHFSYGYTGFAFLALGIALVFDFVVGTRLLQQLRFYPFLLLYFILTFVFNGYLTARPIVLYHDHQYLAFRIGTVPIEDFIYGAALFVCVLSLLQCFCKQRSTENSLVFLLKALIRWKLKNYKQVHTKQQSNLAYSYRGKTQVAVVGAGIAGISTAILLAERGFSVTLYEAKKHLGGKCGSWKKTLRDGQQRSIDHGFHGFFPCYYNLIDFLQKHNIMPKHFHSTGHYTLANKKNQVIHIDKENSTPLFNIIDLAKKNVYALSKIIFNPAHWKLIALFRYQYEKTFQKYDYLPLSQFIEANKFDKDLVFILSVFSRAFFSTEDRQSTAQIIKNFHFYYLSNNSSLVYDYVLPNYEEGFLAPLRKIMKQLPIHIKTDCAVQKIELAKQRQGTEKRFVVHDAQRTQRYDALVLASDIQATKTLIKKSPDLRSSAKTLSQQVSHMPENQHYINYRFGLKQKLPFEKYSLFVNVERYTVMDAFVQLDAIDGECKKWASKHDGHVIELHSYAVPDELQSRKDIKEALLDDFSKYFPSFNKTRMVDEDFQMNNDFTPFTVGLEQYRPKTETEIPGLLLAGDWVSLPIPCCLLEAAHSSACFAVNSLFRKHKIQEQQIYSVPQKGLFC